MVRETRKGKQRGRVPVLREEERGDLGGYEIDTGRVNDDSAIRYGTARDSMTRERYEDGTKTKTKVARLADLERSEKGGKRGSYPILRGTLATTSAYIGLRDLAARAL